jgi:hypothetical protein
MLQRKFKFIIQVVISAWQSVKMINRKEEMENNVCAEKKWNGNSLG